MFEEPSMAKSVYDNEVVVDMVRFGDGLKCHKSECTKFRLNPFQLIDALSNTPTGLQNHSGTTFLQNKLMILDEMLYLCYFSSFFNFSHFFPPIFRLNRCRIKNTYNTGYFYFSGEERK